MFRKRILFIGGVSWNDLPYDSLSWNDFSFDSVSLNNSPHWQWPLKWFSLFKVFPGMTWLMTVWLGMTFLLTVFLWRTVLIESVPWNDSPYRQCSLNWLFILTVFLWHNLLIRSVLWKYFIFTDIIPYNYLSFWQCSLVWLSLLTSRLESIEKLEHDHILNPAHRKICVVFYPNYPKYTVVETTWWLLLHHNINIWVYLQ